MNRLLINSVAAVIAMGSLVACKPADDTGSNDRVPETKPGKIEIPANAVKAGPDLWYAPTGKPSTKGCQPWRAISQKGPVLSVIYWRRADGSFTTNEAEAACG